MKILLYSFLLTLLFSKNIFGAVNPCKIDPQMLGCLPIDHPNRQVTWDVNHSFLVEANPESALAFEGKIYVSTMGKETGPVKNGDGGLSRYSRWGQKDGSFHVKHDLHSPMGMAIINNSLFVADIDRIVSISTNDGSFRFEINLAEEGVNFLNDIVAINSRYLVVSATNQEALYLVDTYKKNYEKLNISISHPNGLAYDSLHKVLYVSGNKAHMLGEYGNGVITAIQLRNNHIENLIFQDFFGHFLDGIAIRGNTLIVSDWKNLQKGSSIFTYRIFTRTILREQNLFISGVADFSLEFDKRSMIIPDLINNKIYTLKARIP